MSQTVASHWSIGEVLSLLQDEFPEITISKIRFLESQGLIDPERTPSGYRRFYESDFDRLRWILVQQRDHYLPLKVIRDRLDAGELEAEVVEETAAVEETSTTAETATPAETSSEQSAESNTAAVLDLTDEAPVPVENLELAPSDIEAVSLLAPEQNSRPEGEPDVDPWASDGPDETNTDATPSADAATEPAATEPAATEDEAAAQEPVVEDAVPSVEELLRRTFSRDELAAEAGCDQRLLHELERFNLISGRTVGTGQVFDEEAVDVAKAAAAFGSFGLEPRHLRAFRLGAEREVGLVAQIVEPMTHRRSSGAHAETAEALKSMSALATAMRDAMTRQLMREHFPEH